MTSSMEMPIKQLVDMTVRGVFKADVFFLYYYIWKTATVSLGVRSFSFIGMTYLGHDLKLILKVMFSAKLFLNFRV